MSRDKRGNRTQEVDGSSPDIQRCFVQKKQFSPGCAGERAQRTPSSFLNTCPKLEEQIMKNKTNGALTHWGSIQRTVLVAALSLASIPASAQTSASNGTEVPENAPIKIGAVVATAGPAALLGNSFFEAIQLAKEDARNTKHQYELVIEE